MKTYTFLILFIFSIQLGYAQIEENGTDKTLPAARQVMNPTIEPCLKLGFQLDSSALLSANALGNQNTFFLYQLIKLQSSKIYEMKMEIIYVKHQANDPQCMACTKHANTMGLFTFANATKPSANHLGSGISPWTSIGIAEIGLDANSDNHTNQLIWKASDIINGVDFSTGMELKLPLSLTETNDLECCEHEYRICMRYTFTDTNCNTCDFYTCVINDGTQNL